MVLACLDTQEQGEYIEENGKPKVFKRRFYILAAYCMGYFMYSLGTYRQGVLTQEYAEYYDTTNEFQSFDELGVDFIIQLESLLVTLFYPIASVLMDKYGIKMMGFGSVFLAIANWWWYLSFDNFHSVVASRLLAATAGPLIAITLLRMSQQWFPETERAKAVAMGTLISLLGAGAAPLMGPMFHKEGAERVINIDLKSCQNTFKTSFNATIDSLSCSDEAEDAFCCFTPTDLDLYNLTLAIITTLVAIYTVAVLREKPSSPPSHSGRDADSPGIVKATKHLVSHWNYMQMSLADFISTGPPIALFYFVSRIFPASVAEYNTTTVAVGFVIAIPTAAVYAYYLDKHKVYFSFTAAAYVGGFLFWGAATICFAVGTYAADVAILFLAGGAIVAMIGWTVAVYELKLEYVYTPEFNIQDYVVGYDRTIINLSSLVFISLMAPEQYGTDGRTTTMVIGLACLVVGTVLVLTTRDKYAYKRTEYETEKKGNAMKAVSI